MAKWKQYKNPPLVEAFTEFFFLGSWGRDGLREQTRTLPRRLTSPYFLALQPEDWFRAVILEYPERVEWVEPPTRCPDPTDPAVHKAAWEAIPRIVADKPDVWPLKGS